MMARCLELAERGLGYTRTNPLVGSVVVREGRIISEGWHAGFGKAHSEVMALECLPMELRDGSTLYVNLEPCCHTGKTPPCTDLILKSRLKKVVVAHSDPDARVSGRGLEILRQAGLEVLTGVLEKDAQYLNRAYFVQKNYRRPFITLKWAQTADGFISGPGSHPIKITQGTDDLFIHWLRTQHDAILIGYRTAVMDNPRLTVRHLEGKNPLRVVWDPENGLPKDLQILKDDLLVWIFNRYCERKMGEKIWKKAADLKEVLRYLLEADLGTVLVEGGRATLDFFISCNLWDQIYVFKALNVLAQNGVAAPSVPNGNPVRVQEGDRSLIELYENHSSHEVFH